jgi:aromatic-L-amino-acid/L-tryptophan decarboxylase
MDVDQFRALAHQVVDWMADHLRDVEQLPVVPSVKPGEVRAALPDMPPEAAEPFEAIWGDFLKTIVPGVTHWNHPGWFAYFPANHSPPSILAEMAVTALGAQCMSWQTSPAATELEQVVMDWLRRLLGLPEGFTGVIQDTASAATLVALLSARERATAHAFAADGARADGADRLMVYTSTEAHSSVLKAARLAGFGQDHVRRLQVDEVFALRPEALATALDEDRAAGLVPACVVATVGTTSSAAVDPLPAIGRLCEEHGAWLHVDGAYGGAAAILPERRHLLAGIERADSFVMNPHKWLMTSFDCSAYFVRDPDHLVKCFGTSPEYLKTAADDQVANFRDWGIPLGRRFRALKLWFVLRSYGAEGLRALLRRHVELAAWFSEQVDAHEDLERVAPVDLGLVCFRLRPQGSGATDDELDSLNQRLLATINEDRSLHLTHTALGGRYTLRMSIGQRTTERRHVEAAWARICTSVGEML